MNFTSAKLLIRPINTEYYMAAFYYWIKEKKIEEIASWDIKFKQISHKDPGYNMLWIKNYNVYFIKEILTLH